MNFLDLCQFVADNSDATRPTTVYNANTATLSRSVRRWRNHVNSAYVLIKQALGKKDEYVETTTTVQVQSGSQGTPLPDGILSVDEVSVGNEPPMRLLPWKEFNRYRSDSLTISITGTPDLISIYERKFHFYPTPDQEFSLTVRGIAPWIELNADADIPALGTEFHRAIAEMALYFELAYENNPQAGLLVTSENGSFSGQGGQAAKAVLMFNVAKKNMRKHTEDSPRMYSRRELARYEEARRTVRD